MLNYKKKKNIIKFHIHTRRSAIKRVRTIEYMVDVKYLKICKALTEICQVTGLTWVF